MENPELKIFKKGQQVTWNRKLGFGQHWSIHATFIEYRGKSSALIKLSNGDKVVRLSSLR
jgi:hypothetical protein